METISFKDYVGAYAFFKQRWNLYTNNIKEDIYKRGEVKFYINSYDIDKTHICIHLVLDIQKMVERRKHRNPSLYDVSDFKIRNRVRLRANYEYRDPIFDALEFELWYGDKPKV